jgi:hypothetical protein
MNQFFKMSGRQLALLGVLLFVLALALITRERSQQAKPGGGGQPGFSSPGIEERIAQAIEPPAPQRSWHAISRYRVLPEYFQIEHGWGAYEFTMQAWENWRCTLQGSFSSLTPGLRGTVLGRADYEALVQGYAPHRTEAALAAGVPFRLQFAPGTYDVIFWVERSSQPLQAPRSLTQAAFIALQAWARYAAPVKVTGQIESACDLYGTDDEARMELARMSQNSSKANLRPPQARDCDVAGAIIYSSNGDFFLEGGGPVSRQEARQRITNGAVLCDENDNPLTSFPE